VYEGYNKYCNTEVKKIDNKSTDIKCYYEIVTTQRDTERTTSEQNPRCQYKDNKRKIKNFKIKKAPKYQY
jgi:hypothetical protein